MLIHNTQLEAQLLICCARVRLDAGRAKQIGDLLQAGINWENLLQFAHWHGLLPLLYKHFGTICPEAIPYLQSQRLARFYRQNAIRNHYLAQHLIDLLRLFETHGISAIPFKGPTLAATVYGNIELRQFVDLDILIHKRHIIEVKALLSAQGYGPKLNAYSRREKDFLKFHYHYAFVRAQDGIMVEMHWDVASNFLSFPFQEMNVWSRLGQAKLAGTQVPTFAPEDLLLLLCVHGAKHLWNKLEWICGVAELTRAYPHLDWPRALEQAESVRSGRTLKLGLRLADELLGAELPEFVRARLQADETVKPLIDQVRNGIFQGKIGQPDLMTRQLFHLRTKEHLTDKFKYCFYYAISPGTSEWALLPLPAFASPLYRLLRLMRLVRVYGAIFLAYLFGRKEGRMRLCDD